VSNYVSEAELNVIQGLLHYLNQNMIPNEVEVGADITLTDPNGDSLGTIAYEREPGYVLRFPNGRLD
jgi:hypothetical protein